MYTFVVHIMFFTVMIMLECPQFPWLICSRRSLMVVRVFFFLMDAFMIHFLFLRVGNALRSSSCEGDVTSFPPRINTVLGVTCLSSLALLALFAYVHTLVSESPILLLTSYSPNLWSEHAYFNIYKITHSLIFTRMRFALCFPTWNTSLNLHHVNINVSKF